MRNGRSSRLGVAIGSLACAALVVLSVIAPAAYARHAPTHVYSSTFHAPYGAPGGENGLNSIAVDEQSGYVYLENARATQLPLEKFTAEGEPAPFTAPEANASNTVLSPGAGGNRGPSVEVDNSGNQASQGRIYVSTENPGVMAFEPSGERIQGNFPIGPGARDVAIEPGTGNIWVDTTQFSTVVTEYTPEGAPTGRSFEVNRAGLSRIAIDSQGHFYLTGETSTVYRYTLSSGSFEAFGTGSDVAVDPTTDDVYTYTGGTSNVKQYSAGGALLFEFGSPPASTNGIPSIAVNGGTGWVYRGIGGNVDIFTPGPTVILPDTTTEPASDFQATSVTLHGTVNPDGEATTECYFEWGTTTPYANKAPCEQGDVLSGSTPQEVSVRLTELEKGTRYHYRVVAVSPNGTIAGLDSSFTPSASPTFSDEYVSNVHSDSVVLHGTINPEGAAASYRFEYGLSDCSLGGCQPLPSSEAPLGIEPQSKSIEVTSLEAGTTYHYRIVGENQSGSEAGGDHTFTTFPVTKLLEDKCPNSHVRQQTSAALLLDCRAYELVSAEDAGGYDVESTLVPGNEPFSDYPDAGNPSQILYAVHDGAIPGAGNPANHGPDTYVATRGEHGWTTKYVGIPSDNPYAGGPFASSLLEADPALNAFAYGGEEICDPCFGDGSRNIPLRLPDGSLVEGIAGSQSPGPAEPAGHIAKYFSADGRHFVFGTTTQIEPAGNDNGDVSIYERDLEGGGTEVVSTTPGGETMTGPGIGELDVSADGSRVVVGRLVSTDSAGNEYWMPYMHVVGSSRSIELAPGASDGVLYAGMTESGSAVFFTTTDSLVAADTDSSADLYEAEVDAAGHVSLKLLSTGQTPPLGNSDACDPAPNANGNNWNAVGAASPDSCGVVAIGGKGGVASRDGTVYFLSPEALDGSGMPNEPNLFVLRPGGTPAFVATLEPESQLVRDAVAESGKRVFGDFQVTPDGRYAAFSSLLSLTGFDNGGFSEVFRYDATEDTLVCASCNPTNARAVGPSTLPRVGLGLAEDGSVFFDSGDAIAPRDLDGRVDAYEYEDGKLQLISTGSSPFDSRMLGISADGKDAYFFTRDTLVPQDENGDLVKVYDARVEGGFPYVPPPVPCRASDECHGNGTQAPPPPKIPTIRGTSGNEAAPSGHKTSRCGRHRVRRHGRCVKGKRRHHRHHKRHERGRRQHRGATRQG